MAKEYRGSYSNAGDFPKPLIGFFRGILDGETEIVAEPGVVQERAYQYYDVHDIAGTPTIVRKSQPEIDAIVASKAQSAADAAAENSNLLTKIKELIDTMSYQQLIEFVDNNFSGLSPAEKKLLKVMGCCVLHYGKKAV